jgi:imidazolonepropionase-like amidohydrolase
VNSQEKGVTLSGVHVPGNPSRYFDILIEDRYIAEIRPSAPGQAGERWVRPGVIDAHTHLAWTDFDEADQKARSPENVFNAQVSSYIRTVKAGVSTVRDAGGLSPDLLSRMREKAGLPLRASLTITPLGRADAKGPGYIAKQVEGILDAGAQWIKLMVTGGIGSPSEKVLEPLLSKGEIEAAVHTAHSRGVKVMAHVWGGTGLDWAISAGVDSVEHCVYLSGEQAEALAAAKTFLVPTVAIYRMVADGSGPAKNNSVFRQRAALAAEAQPQSLCRAYEAGVPLALGCDFGRPEEHGQNLKEIDALVSCGLTRREAWEAATIRGAELLGLAHRTGSIKPGFFADLLVCSRDPDKTPVDELDITAVVIDGKLIHADDSQFLV